MKQLSVLPDNQSVHLKKQDTNNEGYICSPEVVPPHTC